MKVLCFDLDDTICSLWEGETIAKFKLRAELAKLTDTPADIVARTYDITWAQIKQVYMDMVTDGLGEHEIRTIHMNIMMEELWIDGEPESLASLHMETMLEHMHVYPDAEKVIEELSKKYIITMITNGASDLQWEKINKLSFKDKFNQIIVSQDLGHHKPSGVIFEEMAKRTNTPPNEIVYIGNDYRKDILGSHGAGWSTVWVNRKGEPAGEVKPDWTIKELGELLEIF